MKENVVSNGSEKTRQWKFEVFWKGMKNTNWSSEKHPLIELFEEKYQIGYSKILESFR